MGNLSKLAPECAKCSRRDVCTRKRMVKVAYVEQPLMQEGAVGVAQPLLVGKIGQHYSMGNQEKMLQSIKDALKKELYAKQFMNYGA